jgi:predicted heme/steroid binding protein
VKIKLESQLIQKLYSIHEKIDYYNERMMVTICPYAKNYYGYLIKKKTKEAKMLISIMSKEKMQNDRVAEIQKQFTLEELKKYDGSNGKPAYVAIDGIVYDISLSSPWGGGTHFGLYAGTDLTKEFKACHAGKVKILEGLPKVGQLKA